jgi:hypothetical protein
MNRLARHAQHTLGIAALALLAASSAGCGGDDNPYKPQPAWSGKKANIPAPMSPASSPIKSGDSYTVYGAIHQLRSLLHGKEVTANPITITGYIVDSNVARAPVCSIHKTGKGDDDKCQAEVPSFWIADTKDAGKDPVKSPKIRVVGWARNYAVICDAMKAYNKLKPGEQPKEAVKDDILNVDEPNPLPSVGAKVKIVGAYNVSKTVVSDMVSEPLGGVVAMQKMETLEPAPAPAAFSIKKADCGS